MRIGGGRFKGREIPTTSGPGYRPATAKVREAIFNMLAARGFDFDGARVADLFAGSGALGLEGLSRGAAFALFVDKDRKASELIRRVLRDLGVPPAQAEVRAADVSALLPKGPSAFGGRAGQAGPFQLVFADPPYGQGLLAPALAGLLRHGWLAPEGFLLAEVEAGLEVEAPHGLEMEADRIYGQTRILLWRTSGPA